jgi:hypothetical protein
MISPFEETWYTNFDWLFDEPGLWLDYMKNTCRPVWVLFGDFSQQKTTDAIEQLAQVSQQRGYSSSNNLSGDIVFLYVNTSLYVPIEGAQENDIGAPSAAKWASVRSTPTQVIYIAGMEYKRHWGVVNSGVVDGLCDHYSEIMSIFRQNAGLAELCASPASWRGYKESRKTIVEGSFAGSKATTAAGDFVTIDGGVESFAGSKATTAAGDFVTIDGGVESFAGSKATTTTGDFNV